MRRDSSEVFEVESEKLLPAAPELVVEALDPLLTDERRARLEATIAARTRSVVPVLDGLIDPHNIAAVLRSADAFGVQEVHVVEGTEPFLASSRVATGAHQWLDLVRHTTTVSCIQSLHDRHFQVWAATANGGLPLHNLTTQSRIAVLFGNEHAGISTEALQQVDGTVAIPIRGFVESLNVSVAAAITLHWLTSRRPGDLSEKEKTILRARFMMLSVKRAEQVVEEHLRRQAL